MAAAKATNSSWTFSRRRSALLSVPFAMPCSEIAPFRPFRQGPGHRAAAGRAAACARRVRKHNAASLAQCVCAFREKTGAVHEASRHLAMVATAPVALLAANRRVFAQDYPTKTITLVVPFPPGGGNDAMARIMADRLTRRPRPHRRGREPRAGRRHRRHAFRGQGGARRLHADARPHRQHRHQSDALRQRRLRSAQGFHRARADRAVVARPARASVGQGQGRGGA